MTAAAGAQAKLTSAQWGFLVLLLVSVGINYIDRGNLSVAAPQLSTELALSPSQMGVLLSSFFWTYALLQVVAGWLVDRFDVSLMYGLGFFIWSLATGLTGLAGSFAALFALRLLLGAGEAVAFPAYSKIIANHVPESRRGLANAMVDVGTKAGPALGTLIGGLLVANFGWRVLFIVLGLGALLWLPPWAIWAPRDRHRVVVVKDGETPSLVEILRQRSAWGTFLGLFAGNYAWYFMLTWLPSYLVQERHFSMSMMAVIGSVPFWGIAASSITGGWLSDRWIARGAGVTRVRKTFCTCGLLGCTLMLPAAAIPNAWLSMGLLLVACLLFGMFSSNLWATTQTIAGPAAAGKWTGLQNCLGNMAGVIAPIITGIIVQKTGFFFLAFLAASVVLVIGALSYIFIVGPVEPIDWKAERQRRQVLAART
jgi:MFS transporter, ACS family, D-galactonate transporter